MYILIHRDGTLSLEEHDNMKNFSVVYTAHDTDWSAFDAISEPAEDNHRWIKVESVISLSRRAHDAQWIAGFRGMLKAGEPYGYTNLEENLVKAHIVLRA